MPGAWRVTASGAAARAAMARFEESTPSLDDAAARDRGAVGRGESMCVLADSGRVRPLSPTASQYRRSRWPRGVGLERGSPTGHPPPSAAPEVGGALLHERPAARHVVFAGEAGVDQALDTGEVALRTGATVVGSSSTANVAPPSLSRTETSPLAEFATARS